MESKNSLTGKMICRLLHGLAVGIFLIVLLYFGCKYLMKQYFWQSGFLYNAEVERAEELQDYVTKNKLAATDSDELRAWAEERNIKEFTVSREDVLLFDITYDGELYPGAKEVSALSWRYYFAVTFSDGDANVYLYEGAVSAYYNILLGISVIVGFAACLGVFISGMQEDVRYIRQLEREVNRIREGDLTQTVTLSGSRPEVETARAPDGAPARSRTANKRNASRLGGAAEEAPPRFAQRQVGRPTELCFAQGRPADELVSLAAGLDEMRRSLDERERTERELREAQKKLVLGMSHDIRTPLTGLMTYMEILKRQESEGHVSRDYIDKAYDKILQIKGLSDQMFEYFLIDSQKEAKLEEPEEAISAFGDYLSELCGLLISKGFTVNTDSLDWRPALVCVSTDYVGRIMNNIISNIEKYADKSQEIRLELLYEHKNGIAVAESAPGLSEEKSEADYIELSFTNGIAVPNQYVEGTGIGVKNISMMMNQMHGFVRTEISEEQYCIALFFPVLKKK
ncbi:MAG: HAMP domain-containing histidine kinase [Lachnospiraceae bacterium]|nr:HAMP domain-containing histidine kinase [Lachnospiraceae bacterium]